MNITVTGHLGNEIRLGFIRDSLPTAQRGFKLFRAPGDGVPISNDIWLPADQLVAILQQSGLGSCAGHSCAEGDFIAALATNPNAVMGSRQWMYRCGRITDGALQQDAGTTFRSIFTEAAKIGIPPETSWPYDATKTGDPNGDGAATDQFRCEPPADVVRLAYDRRETDGVLEASCIDDMSGDIGDNVDAALAANRPVCIGVDVGEDFCAAQFDPSQPVDVPTKSVGGHAMLCVGRRVMSVRGTRQRWYLIRNSWGASFANGGRFWMTEGYVRTGDLWLVNRAPAQLVTP